MKIVFLMVYSDLGGAEVVAYQHAKIAKERGLDVTILCPDKGVMYDKMINEGINIIYSPELLTSKRTEYLEIHLKNADVVYNCNYWAIVPFVSLLKQKYNFKYLMIVHSNIDWVILQLNTHKNIIDIYLATHNLIKKELLKNGFPDDKIILIPNSIDVSEIPATTIKTKELLKMKLGIPEDDLVVGMTTRINNDKNVIDIVKVIDRVNEKRSVSFVLIGDECYTQQSHDYKEEILKRIAESPYKDKYHLLGKLSTSTDVYYWQQIFDIAINTSPSEGTPISLFEQMAGGIYCIYPSMGGIPDILKSNGSVIPIRQRMLTEEIYKLNCYTDEEIQLYVDEIFKYSKEYLCEVGIQARKYIKKNRDIEIFKNSIVNFLYGKNIPVSVLMTTYNTNVEYLEKSIDSILNQTYSDFEFVISDDCSTKEDTISLLKEYSLKDKRIRLFFKPENTNLGESFNYGLNRCSSNWIIKMDHDDIAEPTLIEKQLKYIKRYPDTIVCGVQIKCFGKNDTVIHHPLIVTKEYAKNTKNNWFINHPGVIYRKDVIQNIGGYIEKRGTSEDNNLWYRLLKEGYVLNNQNEVLLNYRISDSNYTLVNNKNETYKQSLIDNRKLLFEEPESNLTIKFKEVPKINKLGVAYSVFDDLEHLEQSLLSIRANTDFIVIVYQNVSYAGNLANKNIYGQLQPLMKKGLIDNVQEYRIDLKLSAKENEVKKRNLGLQVCKNNQCSHHITIDGDEMYIPEQFKKAKQIVYDYDYEASFLKSRTYYKTKNHIITPAEEFHIPFIYKITDKKFKLGATIYGIFADPSRIISGIEKDTIIFERELIEMHHLCYVRNDIERKLLNKASSLKNGKMQSILNSYNNFKKYKFNQEVVTENGTMNVKRLFKSAI